jgi:hypothetical protein
MKTKQVIAGISVATVLAMVASAYAGPLGGGAGAAGALGGSMAGGIGRLSGQGALDGRGAASTSFDRFSERPASRAAKPATTGAESAQRSGGAPAKAVSGGAAHQIDGSAVTALGQTSGQSSSAAKTPHSAAPSSAPPSVMTSAMGAGSVDAQHSRGDNSVAVSGDATGGASRTE